jgi:hypothetical protein
VCAGTADDRRLGSCTEFCQQPAEQLLQL